MRLSLLIPTFNNAVTIERTLKSALNQRHRPLEVIAYDEASMDRTREIVGEVLKSKSHDVETRFLCSESNSGPLAAWRRLLDEATGDWSAFVWSDDVLGDEYSTTLMEGAERAESSGRVIVACSGEVENSTGVRPYYSGDTGVATAVEYSEGMFLRRFPLTQICAIYQTPSARQFFDRHIDIENPRGYDYKKHPYGNDVGFLSELAMAGNGVELIGHRLVTLVDSESSMTRDATHHHLWQMRWQYTFSFLRVWRWWAADGIPGAQRLVELAERRLALCSIMLGSGLAKPRNFTKALAAYRDFRKFDYQRRHLSLEEHRELVADGRPQPWR
jgi:glycosyltransferase involved in cell wall biosynthesis